LGTPVAAFQVKKSDTDRSVTYQIYSLKKPPRLLRAITGEDFFTAKDRDFDGLVEIWTTDAGAVRGLDDLDFSDPDFAPTVVLRFESGRLTDVSAEFQFYFDSQIEQVRAQLDRAALMEFKGSDGRLQTSSLAADKLFRLRNIKIKVLEIVLAYLYSGREQEAWATLADTWPAADVDRVRAIIVNARAHGIDSQVDRVSEARGSFRPKKLTSIFGMAGNPGSEQSNKMNIVDTNPQAILLWRPTSSMAWSALSKPTEVVDLVIDAAGKVHSATPLGTVDKDVINSALGWKFIPAFKGGRAVASRLILGVSAYR
jgi:hypothetical protein